MRGRGGGGGGGEGEVPNVTVLPRLGWVSVVKQSSYPKLLLHKLEAVTSSTCAKLKAASVDAVASRSRKTWGATSDPKSFLC